MNLIKSILFVASFAAYFREIYSMCNEKNLITVNSSKSNISCTRQDDHNIVCPTLDSALDIKYFTDTCIKIETDSPQTLRTPKRFENVRNFTITAVKLTDVKCTNDVKISIINSQFITINNLNFSSCGSYSKKDTFHLPFDGKEISLSSTIYVSNTSTVLIENSYFFESIGYAIVLVDCTETIKFQNVHFISNQLATQLHNNSKYGGSVIVIYSFEVDVITRSNNQYFFINSEFSFNEATDNNTTDETYYTDIQSPYGNGAGLAVLLHDTFNITVQISSGTMFNSNFASWGAGLYVEMTGETRDTVINIDHSLFDRNAALYSGGGIRTVKQHFNKNNILNVSYSLFNSNLAEVGGSISQIYTDRLMDADISAHVTYLISSKFQYNYAKLGSALYFEYASVIIYQGDISSNGLKIPSDIASARNTSVLSGVGAIYVYRGIIILGGERTDSEDDLLVIKNNSNTAIVLEKAELLIFSAVDFIKNAGTNGGAIGMYEHSTITFGNRTSVNFKDNKANQGGAIYVHVSGPPLPLWNSQALLLYKCFLKFGYNSSSNYFQGEVNFINNTALQDSGNDIYSTTIQNCRENKNDSLYEIITNWKNFHFTHPVKAIRTDPINITVNESDFNNTEPGIPFNVSILVIDERNQSISSPVDVELEYNNSETKMCFESSLSDNTRKIVYDNKIELTIKSSSHHSLFSVIIKTPSGRTTPKQIENKNLSNCQFGYTFSKILRSCVCFNKYNQNRMISKCIGKDIYLYSNIWAKPHQTELAHDDKEKTQVCPPGYCKECQTKNKTASIDCIYKPNNQCREDRNQSALLCGSCQKGYSISFGSEACVDCSHGIKRYTWIFIIFGMLLIIPTFIIIIAKLNIDVYEHLLNSTFFFYQYVDMLFTPTQTIMAKCDPMTFIIHLLQLNGIFTGRNTHMNVCFAHNFDNLDKSMVNYLIPAIMILTLAVIALIMDRNNLHFRYVRPSRTFIFIMVLAYCDIIRITLNVLQPVTIGKESRRVYIMADQEYFKHRHFWYGIVAAVIGFIFVLGFPVILLLSACKAKCLSKYLIPLRESFHCCFKGNRKSQCFSCYYFICRLSLSLLTVMNQDQLKTSIIAILCFVFFIIFSLIRPFENDWYNYYDMFVLFDFALIAFLSNGKLKLQVYDENDQVIADIILILLWLPISLWVIAMSIKYAKTLKIYATVLWEKIPCRAEPVVVETRISSDLKPIIDS